MFRILTFCILLLLPEVASAAGFVHPLDFKETKSEKDNVINYIKNGVKETYTKIGMGDPSTLRMMEKKELEDFKKLTKVKNRKILDNVISTYCKIGMCNYNTIYMMYNKQLEASKESLDW